MAAIITPPAENPGADSSSDVPRSGKEGAAASTAKATALTIGLVLLSRVLGVLRDSVIADKFGQNEATTVFRAAFGVPDLIALVIAGGALSSVFVPLFAQYWNEKREDEAWKMFGSVMSIVGVIVAVLVIGMEIAVVPLTQLINPKFSDTAIAPTAALTQILLPVQWCLLVGGLMMGTLYARKRFLVPGIAGLVYNIGQIIGGLIGGSLYPYNPALPYDTRGLTFMAYGALVGAFVGNIAIPLWEMRRVGVKWRIGFDFRHPGVVKMGQLMIPILLGQSLSQLNMWLTGRFLPDDARYSALTYAYNLTQAPIGIFAQAFGIVLLPTISLFAAQQDWPAFRRAVSEGVRRVLFLTVPASVIMAALAEPLIRLFLKRGAFTESDVPMAATALVCYSLATFAWSASAILSRGFIALQETRTPVYITTPMVAVFIAFAYLYTKSNPNGYIGLALATSFVGTLTMLLLLFCLHKRVGRLNLRGIASSTLRIALASLCAGGAAWWISSVLENRLPLTSTASLLTLALAGGAGLIVYAALCFALRVPELWSIKEMFRRRAAAAGGDSKETPVSPE